MLEKIGTRFYEKLSCPNNTFLEYIGKLKQERNVITIAEIGVGIGATAQEAVKQLSNEDRYVIFDFYDKVKELSAELRLKYTNAPEILCYGNSRAAADNYVWSLYNLNERQNTGGTGIFDLVLLDGAHDFTIDLAACALLIKMIKVGGILIIDDVQLTVDTILNYNPRKARDYRQQYTHLQTSA
ncbi:MAG: hypothetical protein RSD35_10360, partial [Oscillospiraceae bacterium]